MRNKIIFFGFILITAFVLRFHKLGEIPNGLERDETSLGYNAYSILLTGKDEHGIWLPQNFKAFGEYKLPGYIYILVPFIKVFGLTPFSVRFPSALLGFLTVPIFYLLLKEFFKQNSGVFIRRYSDTVTLISTLLLAINPWHIHFSRGAFEVTVALFFLTFGTYLFFRGLQKHPISMFFSAMCFALSAYTYNISRLFIPFFLFTMFCVFRKEIHTFSPKIRIAWGVAGIVCFLPLLLGLAAHGGFSSTSGTFIFSSAAVQAPLLEFRSYLVSLPSIFVKSFFNSYMLTIWHYITNIVSYASVQFFFITGSPHGNHGIGNTGQWYVWEFITVIAGLFTLFRHRTDKAGLTLLAWIFITITVASLTRETPQATRSFFLIVPVTVCSGIGVITIIQMLEQFKNISKLFFGFGLIFIIYNFIFYLTTYYIQFPVSYAKAWSSEDKSLSEYMHKHDTEYDSILVDKDAGFSYTSLLFYTKYDPLDFQKAAWSGDDSEGFSYPIRFGKYEYKTIDWENDTKRPNALIITKSDTIPKTITPLVSFSYPTRPVVIAVGQKILQYPVSENAYTLVATNQQ